MGLKPRSQVLISNLLRNYELTTWWQAIRAHVIERYSVLNNGRTTEQISILFQ